MQVPMLKHMLRAASIKMGHAGVTMLSKAESIDILMCRLARTGGGTGPKNSGRRHTTLPPRTLTMYVLYNMSSLKALPHIPQWNKPGPQSFTQLYVFVNMCAGNQFWQQQ